jgi:hypothetical protein
LSQQCRLPLAATADPETALSANEKARANMLALFQGLQYAET